jgi:hypothetical protein
MKRLFWTLAMGVVGLFLGLKGQDTGADAWWTAFIVFWFATLGYCIGSIFDQKRPTQRLILYWAATLALVAPFWALPVAGSIQPDLPNLPFRQQATAGAVSAVFGAVFGALVGTIHLRRLRGRSERSHCTKVT